MLAPAPTRYAPPSRETLYVSEIFPSLQGEGPHSGEPATFLRLMGCNLHCTWCDTAYTWDHRRYRLAEERHPLTVEAVAAQLRAQAPRRLILTGGEPLLQAAALGPLLHTLMQADAWQVEVETNGTRPPPSTWLFHVAQWNVSPKLPHSGNLPAEALNLPLLRIWASMRTALFKFVCCTPHDVGLAADLAASVGMPPERVWIMPEGVTAPVQLLRLRRLVSTVIAHGFNLSPRLHVLLWGAARGR